MKTWAILAVLVLSLSAFSALAGDVSAGPPGLWKNTPPWWTERLKAQAQGNSTEDFITQYPDPRSPSYIERASMFSLPPQVLIEILAATFIVSLVAFAAYLYKSERSPEQALKESTKPFRKS